MAKHDQRILKFLTQNAERAPTITDMMTRLNISISDITASLNSLLSQGIISRRTNAQGIECWFPANGAAPQPVAESAPGMRGSDSRFLSNLNNPSPPAPSPLPPLQPTLPSLSASSAFPASLTSPSALSRTPEPDLGPAWKTGPAAPAESPIPMAPSAPPPASGIEILPGVPQPQAVPAYSLAQPARSGVGFVTFLAGLLAVGAVSVWLGGRLVRKDLAESSKNYVDKAAMDAAVNSWGEFEAATKAQMKTLETEVKNLNTQLAAMKVSNDSLQAIAAARQAEEKPVAKKPVRRRR